MRLPEYWGRMMHQKILGTRSASAAQSTMARRLTKRYGVTTGHSLCGSYPASTASTFLSAIVGATAALTGFVVTVTVLVIQMATGTFSARILRHLYRDRMLKATLAVLVGTFTYSFAVLQRIEEDFVPDLGVTLAGFFISLSLLVFIVFFDRFIRQLKPVAVAAYVARAAFHA